jgi:hypothetical protein
VQVDFPCICGHSKNAHLFAYEGSSGSCHMTKSGKILNTSVIRLYADDCINFKPDNLKYLEQLSGQS